MASVPNKIEKFQALENDLSTSVAKALWKKAADLCEYINKSRPIGMIMYFNDQQTLLPEMPDPKYWKLCDGTAVVNANSPLNGVVIPDIRFRFIKHPDDGQIVLGSGGQASVNLSHNHGGVTGIVGNFGNYDLEAGTTRNFPMLHSHTVDSALGSTSTLPKYKEFPCYMRIA